MSNWELSPFFLSWSKSFEHYTNTLKIKWTTDHFFSHFIFYIKDQGFVIYRTVYVYLIKKIKFLKYNYFPYLQTRKVPSFIIDFLDINLLKKTSNNDFNNKYNNKSIENKTFMIVVFRIFNGLKQKISKTYCWCRI